MEMFRESWQGRDTVAEAGWPTLPAATPAAGPHDPRDWIEAPPPAVGQEERRLQVRAYNRWAGLLGEAAFPLAADLDIAGWADVADHAVVLDFAGSVTDPQVVWLGAVLAAECGAEGAIARLSEVPPRSLLARITDTYLQVLANAAPIGFEAEAVNAAGRTIVFRGMLLPFSHDGATIGRVLGVINGKEVAPLAIADGVLRELGEAGLAAWAPAGAGADFAATLAAAQAAAAALAGPGGGARQRLYDAIGAAWDLALAAEAEPAAFARALGPAGIVVRAQAGFRAPLLAIAKLAFGPGHDKTRLTEIATVLGHARRLGLPARTLAGYLRAAPGGLKAVIAAARRAERPARGLPAAGPAGGAAREGDPAGWRGLPAVALADIAGEGPGFTLIAARRGPGGIELLGEIAGAGEVLRRLGKRARLRTTHAG